VHSLLPAESSALKSVEQSQSQSAKALPISLRREKMHFNRKKDKSGTKTRLRFAARSNGTRLACIINSLPESHVKGEKRPRAFWCCPHQRRSEHVEDERLRGSRKGRTLPEGCWAYSTIAFLYQTIQGRRLITRRRHEPIHSENRARREAAGRHGEIVSLDEEGMLTRLEVGKLHGQIESQRCVRWQRMIDCRGE